MVLDLWRIVKQAQIWPNSLHIVRHGESAGNVARDAATAAGHHFIDINVRDVDVPLSDLGQEQARALGRWYGSLEKALQPEIVLTSPYLRARHTAEIIIAESGIKPAAVVVDERFREKEFGILDRLTAAGISAAHPEQADFRKLLGKFYHRPPGGESWTDVILRLRSALEMISREYCGCKVLIVCHSVVVLCMRYLIEHMTEEQILAIDKANEIANCSVTSYFYDSAHGPRGQLSLDLFNFVAPLQEAGAPVTSKPDAKVGAR